MKVYERILILIILLCAVVVAIYFASRAVTLGKRLEQKDAELTDLSKQNDEIAKERDAAIAEKEAEIEKILEEDKEHMKRIDELEPAVAKADSRNAQLKEERKRLEATNASCEEKLKVADAQISVLESAVSDLRTQKNEALADIEKLHRALDAKDGIIADWIEKYESERALRINFEGAYGDIKDQVRILKLKGMLGGIGGAALGLAAGLLLGK